MSGKCAIHNTQYFSHDLRIGPVNRLNESESIRTVPLVNSGALLINSFLTYSEGKKVVKRSAMAIMRIITKPLK
jgi:glutaminase